MMSHGWNLVETAEDYSDNIFHIRGARSLPGLIIIKILSWIFGPQSVEFLAISKQPKV